MTESLDIADPVVRIFVPTYRRSNLLQRAIHSLRNQTFTRWVCEVHNDDPKDRFPSELVKSLNDARLKLHDHDQNLGGVETFNLFYSPVKERFVSLLEDDNWWEPEFLATMLNEIKKYPNVLMAWCNQRVWEELPNGSWIDTGRLVNPDGEGPRLIEFGDERQIIGALHANGAMLLRSVRGRDYALPSNLPFNAMEAFRERMIPHPLLYVPRPLAVFSKTLKTHRSRSHSEWTAVQTMLAATFLKYARYDRNKLVGIFKEARAKSPPVTNVLLLAAIVESECRGLLHHSVLKDWFMMLRSVIRRPQVFWTVICSKWRHADWWRMLDYYTSERFAELRQSIDLNS
jgi:glycosyltransferase involved in cell wall biosynthesis